MARTHGKILCSIWHDEDFTSLPADAQRLYLIILSQGKLNLVGALDYWPGRLAAKAPDTSIEDIEAALAELEAHRYVIVDRETDELLVRSFTKNDPIQFANSKLRKGIWSAWSTIDSATLREEAIWAMPDVLFEHPEAPAAARHIRTSERTEPPTDPPSNRPPIDQSADSPIGPPTDSPPPPPPPPPPTATSAARPPAERPVDNIGARTLDDGTLHVTGTGTLHTYEPPEPIDDHERALGLAIAHDLRARLDQLDHEHQEHHTA